jgi:hypothetical protein
VTTPNNVVFIDTDSFETWKSCNTEVRAYLEDLHHIKNEEEVSMNFAGVNRHYSQNFAAGQAGVLSEEILYGSARIEEDFTVYLIGKL